MPGWMKWALALLIGFAIIVVGFRWAGWLLTAFFVMNCFVLILVVLLQSGKAADLAGAFGGAGSQTAFGPRGADFIAPHHERVRPAIADLLAFARRADIPTLPQIAIAHAQFEAIHPFTDGNGRTGRVRNLLYLVEQGLLDVPVLYMSRAIIRSRSEYYRLLRAVTSDDA